MMVSPKGTAGDSRAGSLWPTSRRSFLKQAGLGCAIIAAASGRALLLGALAPTAEFDCYGGWKRIRGHKTGFFHVQKIKGWWWLITPEGNGFFSKGVGHITAEKESDSSPAPPTDRARWLADTIRQLRGWNFNTVGGSSDPIFANADFVFALTLGMSSHGGDLSRRIVDYFSQDFRDAADRVAKQRCAPLADNPWLLGYFTDNELRWGPEPPMITESLLEVYLKMAPSAPGRQKAEALLTDRTTTDTVRESAPSTITDADKEVFLEIAAAEYARVARESIRRYDPNHMVLGCRLEDDPVPDPAVLRGTGPYFDVISYQPYYSKVPVALMKMLTDVTGKPSMVTEFSFKAMDSGLPNTKGAGKPVATQQDRADSFAAVVETLADLPGCVGFQWFQYRDQPREGRRRDGENSNYGVVRLDGTPWKVLTDRMREVNATLERRRAAQMR